jgi:polyadenylate-binding protein 2
VDHFPLVLTIFQELEEMKRRVSEMEEEARKLIELQSQVELGSSSGSIGANKEEADIRSVYVGNVRYLCKHVLHIDTISIITLLCNILSPINLMV